MKKKSFTKLPGYEKTTVYKEEMSEEIVAFQQSFSNTKILEWSLFLQ